MIGAIALEFLVIYSRFNHEKIPPVFTSFMFIASVALIIHIIEGIIAAFFTKRKGYDRIKYGIYIFFVGTVGLYELFKQNNTP
jgi:succinate dehydrogenase/fumarate reductase cytochrome b subunit